MQYFNYVNGEKKNISARDQYFARKFSHYYKLWKSHNRGKGTAGNRDQTEFALEVSKALRNNKINRTVHKNSVSNWLNGKQYPSKDSLKAIADVLDVEVSVFELDQRLLEMDYFVLNEYDRIRFEYADQIGLNKNFMLFILNSFSSLEFPQIVPIGKQLQPKQGFTQESFTINSETGDKEIELIENIQCKFRDNKKNDVYSYILPCEYDLDYMLKLQEKFLKFLKIEVDEVKEDSEMRMAIENRKNPDPIQALKHLQREENEIRRLEHRPLLTLLDIGKKYPEFFVFGYEKELEKKINQKRDKAEKRGNSFLPTWHTSDIDVRAKLLEAGEDPDQINCNEEGYRDQ